MKIHRRFLVSAPIVAWALHSAATRAAPTPATADAELPNVQLLNQDGQALRFYDDLVRGRHTVAINFIYAQCSDICPSTTANLARVQALLGERLGREVRMASISLDPRHDTPAVLKAYGASFGARPGWQFFTGRPRDIELLRRALGVFERDPERDRDITQHTGMVLYGNDALGRWGRVAALLPPERIVESITRWS